MALPAERAQQIGLAGIALGQAPAVAGAHHLRAALLAQPFLGRNMRKISRLLRIGDVDDGRAVELGLPAQGIERLGHGFRAAMMPDIGDVAIALLVDDRLIGAACLQVAEADEPHVLGFWWIADLRHLRR
jgi:hypothetical protein